MNQDKAMQTLIILSLICSIVLCISNGIKARKFYKQYDLALFEYNKGRGYLHFYLQLKEKYLTHLSLSIVFLIAAVVLFIIS